MPHSFLRQRSHVAIGATRQMMIMRIADALRDGYQAVSARGGIGRCVSGIRNFGFICSVRDIPRHPAIRREFLLCVLVRSRRSRVRARKCHQTARHPVRGLRNEQGERQQQQAQRDSARRRLLSCHLCRHGLRAISANIIAPSIELRQDGKPNNFT